MAALIFIHEKLKVDYFSTPQYSRLQLSVLPMMNQGNRYQSRKRKPTYAEQPTRVEIDNDSSDRCTVIDVFTLDRPGLLYALSRTIFQCGYSVDLAKIGTHLEQVVDVFYITTPEGEKLDDEVRLAELRGELRDVLNTLEQTENPSEIFSEEE